ncbi:hypothetical protein Ciccas_003798 [Cichlidogyrus casuarinus]|uniref:Uncharacterized protein n=1 Tax=Cichlidogyrus casuarinus TaxID=1844966 RepID=A0ABD2QDB8_9PLAT
MPTKLCRALKRHDFIAEALGLQPLESNVEEDEALRDEYAGDLRGSDSEIRAVEDSKGGCWIPVNEETCKELLMQDYDDMSDRIHICRATRQAMEAFDCAEFEKAQMLATDEIEDEHTSLATPPLTCPITEAAVSRPLSPSFITKYSAPNTPQTPSLNVTVPICSPIPLANRPELQRPPISPGGSSITSDRGSSIASVKGHPRSSRTRLKSQASTAPAEHDSRKSRTTFSTDVPLLLPEQIRQNLNRSIWLASMENSTLPV